MHKPRLRLRVFFLAACVMAFVQPSCADASDNNSSSTATDVAQEIAPEKSISNENEAATEASRTTESSNRFKIINWPRADSVKYSGGFDKEDSADRLDKKQHDLIIDDLHRRLHF